MKLFKGKDLADAIKATNEDIIATERVIADLQKDRQARLLDLSTDELAKTDLLIGDQHRTLQVHKDRLEALQAKLAEEQREQRATEYTAAVDRIEKSLRTVADAADGFENALAALAPAYKHFKEAIDGTYRSWPPNVPKPATFHAGYHLDSVRALRQVHRIFVGAGTAVSPHLGQMIEKADASGFGLAERDHHKQLIDQLHGLPVPEPRAHQHSDDGVAA